MACDSNTNAFVYILLCIVFGGHLHFDSVLEKISDHSFSEYFSAMGGRRKALIDKKKEVIINKSAKGNSLDVINEITGRHIDIVERFLKDPSPRKKRSDAGRSKTEEYCSLAP